MIFVTEARWQLAADRLGMSLPEWIVATLDAASDGDDCGPFAESYERVLRDFAMNSPQGRTPEWYKRRAAEVLDAHLSSRPMAESCVFDACPLPVTESLHVTYRLEGKAPIDADLAVCANHYDHLTRGTIHGLSLTPKAVAAVPRPR